MKALATVLLSLFVSNSYASWTSMKCSNSDGSVAWETGMENDFIQLKYANFVDGTLTLSVEQVNIQFSSEVTINQKSFRSCQMSATRRVFAGKVKIIAADKHPDVLRSQFPENKVVTEVICTMVSSKPIPCEQ